MLPRTRFAGVPSGRRARTDFYQNTCLEEEPTVHLPRAWPVVETDSDSEEEPDSISVHYGNGDTHTHIFIDPQDDISATSAEMGEDQSYEARQQRREQARVEHQEQQDMDAADILGDELRQLYRTEEPLKQRLTQSLATLQSTDKASFDAFKAHQMNARLEQAEDSRRALALQAATWKKTVEYPLSRWCMDAQTYLLEHGVSGMDDRASEERTLLLQDLAGFLQHIATSKETYEAHHVQRTVLQAAQQAQQLSRTLRRR